MAARVAWIVAWAQLAVAPAHAEPGSPEDSGVEQAALAHLDRGVAAYRAGDFAHAHAELAEASRLAPDRPNPYRWLALTEVALGDCANALIHVESFLSHAPAGDPRVGEMDAVRTRCAGIGTVSVASTPSGAAIRVDGGPKVVATTPARGIALPVGTHRLALEWRLHGGRHVLRRRQARRRSADALRLHGGRGEPAAGVRERLRGARRRR